MSKLKLALGALLGAIVAASSAAWAEDLKVGFVYVGHRNREYLRPR